MNQLTKEKFKGLFKSNFDLANYAMRLARYEIKAGKEVNADTLLEQVVRNPNQLQELQMLDALEESEESLENPS